MLLYIITTYVDGCIGPNYVMWHSQKNALMPYWEYKTH